MFDSNVLEEELSSIILFLKRRKLFSALKLFLFAVMKKKSVLEKVLKYCARISQI